MITFGVKYDCNNIFNQITIPLIYEIKRLKKRHFIPKLTFTERYAS